MLILGAVVNVLGMSLERRTPPVRLCPHNRRAPSLEDDDVVPTELELRPWMQAQLSDGVAEAVAALSRTRTHDDYGYESVDPSSWALASGDALGTSRLRRAVHCLVAPADLAARVGTTVVGAGKVRRPVYLRRRWCIEAGCGGRGLCLTTRAENTQANLCGSAQACLRICCSWFLDLAGPSAVRQSWGCVVGSRGSSVAGVGHGWLDHILRS